MIAKVQAQIFGRQLQKFREASHDNERPDKLSRRRFGIELAKVMGLKYGITDDVIYNLEAGRTKNMYQDRELIKGILKVLLKFGAISKLEEANLLLELGSNSPLTANEMVEINNNWITIQTTPLYPTAQQHPSSLYDSSGYVNRYFEENRSDYNTQSPKKDSSKN
ncbi:MAG: hypothetical protein VB013_13820 [Anaerolineaceae bacterium]|nr:hypothetical protein [Anaerolineaceae bacterium]